MFRLGWVIVVLALAGLPEWTAAASLCFAPSISEGVNATYDCVAPVPAAHQNAWIGYDTSYSTACESESPSPSWCDDHGNSRYEWYISSSQTDPNIHNGPIPDNKLYLWLACSSVEGMTLAAFSFTGTLNVLDFTHHNGFLHAGTLPDLFLANGGCPTGPILVGTITVQDPSPVEAGSWGEAKAAYR